MAQVKDLLVKGQAKFLRKAYFQDQIVSNVAQGTAPLVVASSTVVSNLNSDYLDGYHASGLFTALSANSTLSITIGGTTLTSSINAATVDGKYISNYYTKSEADDRFVNVAGDTMSGHLTIKTASYKDQLTIYRNENNNNSVINFSNKDGFLGAIGFTGLGQTGMAEKPHIVLKDSSLHVLLHDGNYTDYTVTKTGTGATGTWGINISGNASTSNRTKFLETFQKNSTTNTYGEQYPIWAQWSDNTNVRLKCTNYTVWTDKATTATDADKLDGYHASSFSKTKIIDLPVGQVLRINVSDWNRGLLISMQGRNGGRNALYFVTGYGDGTTIRNDIRVIKGGPYNLYFNGTSEAGCVYIVGTSTNTAANDYIYINPFDYNDITYTIVSSVPSDAVLVSSSNSNILATLNSNVASATKWATPRTITLTGSVTGSVSIDGSQNVSLATTTNHTHSYAGSSAAGGDATRALAVADYGDTKRTIQIGYAGTGLSTSNLTHIAGYTDSGAKIKDVSKSVLQSWLGLGSAAYTNSDAYAAASHTHSYLPLTGGTITGYLTLKHSSSGTTSPLIIDTNSTVEVGQYFRMSGANKGWIGYQLNYGMYLYTYSGPHKLGLKDDGTGYIDSNTILHSGNFNSYAPKLDGTGATGTWGISISGNAATATNADTLAKPFAENINYAAYTTGLKLIRYDANWEANGFPMKWTSGLSVMAGYCGWQLVTYGGGEDTPYFRKVSDSGIWSNWRALAFTDSNVASATKLATSRTIWGQSFDGTGNVSGSLTGTNFVLMDRASNPYLMFTENGLNGFVQFLGGTIAIGPTYAKSLVVDKNGNVGIGTTSPSSKLHVAGNIYTTTGFKKEGSSDSYVLLGGGGHKPLSEFFTVSTTSGSSVASLYCGSYSAIYIARSSNQTMSFASTPAEGKECHIVIYNNGSSNITITLPSSYRRNVSSITIAASAFGEVNVMTINSIVHVRAV